MNITYGHVATEILPWWTACRYCIFVAKMTSCRSESVWDASSVWRQMFYKVNSTHLV